MRRSYFGTVFFIVAVLAAPPACGAGMQGVAWPELARCAAPVEQGLIAAVVEVLKSGPQDVDAIGSRAEQALRDLAAQYGASTVSCAVAEAVQLLQHRAARSDYTGAWSDAELEAGKAQMAARRGKDFLAVHHIAVEQR